MSFLQHLEGVTMEAGLPFMPVLFRLCVSVWTQERTGLGVSALAPAPNTWLPTDSSPG